MHTHSNAPLTAVSRERFVRRHIQDAEPLADLAAQAAISLRTAYKWLARYRSGGVAALVDRRSEHRTQRRTLDPQQLQHAIQLRHQLSIGPKKGATSVGKAVMRQRTIAEKMHRYKS